jgi:hypothetical protein
MEQHTTNQAPDRETLQDLKEDLSVRGRPGRRPTAGRAGPCTCSSASLPPPSLSAGFCCIRKPSARSVAEEGSLVIPVTGIAVSRAAMVETYKGNGDVAAASSVDVYADTASGKVTDIVAEPGTWSPGTTSSCGSTPPPWSDLRPEPGAQPHRRNGDGS